MSGKWVIFNFKSIQRHFSSSFVNIFYIWRGLVKVYFAVVEWFWFFLLLFQKIFDHFLMHFSLEPVFLWFCKICLNILLSSFKKSHLPTAPNGSKHPTHRTTVIRLLKHLSIPRTKANFSLKTNGSWEMILNVSESSIFSHFGYFTFSLCVHLNVYGILGFRRKLFRPNRHLFQVIFKLTLWSQRRRDRKINKTHTKW